MTPRETPGPVSAETGPGWPRWRGWIILAVALAPASAAIWAVPAFVTQDGPAHLYNAHILNESLGAESAFRDTFQVRWSPLPNWSGHILLMGLLAALDPRSADRMATTLPLIGLAASAFWLRRRVAGRGGEAGAAMFCALVSLNVAWLFGFTSFLLGACLFPITLGVWWGGRDRMTPGRALALAVLIVVGYFGHVVSLGLTVAGLVVLALATPGPRRGGRLGWTAAAMAPLLVLAPTYRGLMDRNGPIRPTWGHFRSFRSWTSWREQIGWVDPISLGRKGTFPGIAAESPLFGLASPAALLAGAVAILIVATLPRLDRGRRGWATLSALLVLGGAAAPDTLGEAHGNYLPQRVVLLGLVALVPWLDFEAKRRPGRAASVLIASALVVQTLWVWDYARESDRGVGPFLRAIPGLGYHRRIGTLLIDQRGRFRANPRLHADNLAGVGNGNVVWANYETAHYYFPVQFRDGPDRPPAEEFEEIATMDEPAKAEERALRWLRLLAEHHREMDVVLVWGADPPLEAITARWFDPSPAFRDGPLRVLRHR